jgi:hypothetical protein
MTTRGVSCPNGVFAGLVDHGRQSHELAHVRTAGAGDA